MEGLRGAVLVGSLVDGTADELSDVDLILVARPPELAGVRRAWRSLIPGRVLYSSERGGAAWGPIHVLTGDLVCVRLTLGTTDSVPPFHHPYRVLFDKDGSPSGLGPGCPPEMNSTGAGLQAASDLPSALLAIARHYMRGETERALSELDAVVAERRGRAWS